MPCPVCCGKKPLSEEEKSNLELLHAEGIEAIKRRQEELAKDVKEFRNEGKEEKGKKKTDNRHWSHDCAPDFYDE